MDSASPRGQLELMVLAIVSEGPIHGYALISELRERSGGVFDLPEGTVYPALHKLHRDGLVTSEWRETGGRSRRTYRISARGSKALNEQRRSWSVYRSAIERVVGTGPWPATD
jgi:PadR family transcriptional regulator PadR